MIQRSVKKFIGWLLTLIMLFSCMAPMGIDAFAAEQTDELIILDFNQSSVIESGGAKANSEITKTAQYSAEWVFENVKILSYKDIPNDMSSYSEIKFWVYGDSTKPVTIYFRLLSCNSATEGDDYYGTKINISEDGWQEIVIPFSSLSVVRSPLGFDQIEAVQFFSTGWEMPIYSNGEKLYIDSIRLSKSTSAPPDDTPVGDKIFYNRTFDEKDRESFEGLNPVPKSNSIAIGKESNGNKYIQFQMAETVTEDCFIDMNIVGPTRYMVVQADFSTLGITVSGNIQYKDSDTQTNYFINLGSVIKTPAGQELGTIEQGKWTNIALAIDFAAATFDVYIDEELVASEVRIQGGKMNNSIKSLRIYLGKNNPGGGTLLVDNYRVYEGLEPRELEEGEGPDSGETPTDPTDYSIVENAICLKLGVHYALVNIEKVAIDRKNEDVVPFVEDGKVLVPILFIADSLGCDISYNNATYYNASYLNSSPNNADKKLTIQFGNDVIELEVGSKQLIKNGSPYTLDVAPMMTDYGTIFVSLDTISKAFDKEIFLDKDMGFIVISDIKDIFDRTTDLKLMLKVMEKFIYDRPTGKQIVQDLQSNSPNHPRLLAKEEDFDRIRRLYQTDEILKGWVDKFIKQADNYLTADLPTYNVDVGGRLKSTNTQNYMFAWGLAYQITADKKYADAAYKHLEVVCGFDDWHPGHFLDAASIMQGVAIGYDWMYDAFTPTQRRVIEEGLYKHAILAGLGAYAGTTEDIEPQHGFFGRSGWTTTENNWNAVCNSGLTMASIAIGDIGIYKKDVAELMGKVIASIELGVRCYAPDGGYGEAPGYWAYGTNNLILMLASLKKAMGSHYGIFNAPGLEQTGYFPNYVESNSNGQWNYHDSSEGFVDTSSLFWFAQQLNDPDLAGIRLQDIINGKKSPAVRDIIWYNPDSINTDVNLPLDKLFSGIDTVTMRSGWTDPAAVFTGLHGGDNAMNHGNLDAGNFILDAGGERWIVDLGSEYYNLPGYFSGGTGGMRWNYYRERAEGQNTIVINPGLKEDQVVRSISPIIAFDSKPRGAYTIVDMLPAHGSEKVTSAKRGLWLTDNRKAVVVQDEISLFKPSEVWWFAHTKGDITIADDGKSAIITQNGKRMWVNIVSPIADARFIKMAADPLPSSPASHPQEYSRTEYSKLAIHLTDVEEYKMAVVFKLLEANQEKPEFEYAYTHMENWSIPDGELIIPRLTDLTIDGQTIDGFEPTITDYEVILPYGTTEVPRVEAITDSSYKVEVTQAAALPGIAFIKVSSISDPTMYTIYIISIRARREIEITASDYQKGNPPENSMDGDLGTRWAAEGEQWIMYTFANSRELSSISLAWWKSNERSTIFDIQISEDGENFITVFSGQQSVKEDILEEFIFEKTTVMAAKIVGHGNTSNNWNSLLEIEFN